MADAERANHRAGRRRSGAAIAIVLAILMPVFYVLSVGPAVMFTEMTGTNEELGPYLEVLYFPVRWLYENTPLRDPLEWYVALWMNP